MIAITNEDFLAHAFRKCAPNEAPWVTGFEGNPYSVKPHLWGGRPIIKGMPWFIQPNHNNYVCVSTFIAAADSSWHRGKKYFSGMHVVMIDDIGTKIMTNKIVLKPSVMVETSPDNFQGWYFLAQPLRDALIADALINGMIENGLASDSKDPGMRGVTRYGRLPVGINGKQKYVEELGKPFVQQVTEWSPETTYSVQEIASAYGVDLNITLSKKRQISSKVVRMNLENSTADLQLLSNAELYLEPMPTLPSAHRIVCPWVCEHTDADTSGTVFFEPSEENAWHGGFKCHHGHCAHRNMADLRYFLNRLAQVKGDKSCV